MNEAWIWRGTLAIVFVVMTLLWQRASRLRGSDRKVYYSEDEGLLLAAPIRLLGLASMLAIALAIVLPSSIRWADVALAPGWRWVGVGLACAGLAGWAWVLAHLGAGLSVSIALREDQSLVETGPYRLVRHPMYTTYLVLWAGFFLLSANWFVLATGYAAHALAMIARAPREEAMLERAFGEQYTSYRHRTGKFFPRIRFTSR